MTTIQLYCRDASAWTKVDGRITRGMVGLNVAIVCDKSWAGLTKSLVARNGDGERWVLAAVGDTAVVPHEALQEEGHLYLCLEGRDGDGHLVLPSNWASCGRIYDSGGGKPGTAAATPTELQQLMVLADQAKRTAEEALHRSGQGEGSPQGGVTEDWVKEQGYLKEAALSEAVDDALEQAKNSGAFDGADGVTPNLQIGTVTTLEAGASATASITGTKEDPVLNLWIPRGQKGEPGTGGGGSGGDSGGTTPATPTTIDVLASGDMGHEVTAVCGDGDVSYGGGSGSLMCRFNFSQPPNTRTLRQLDTTNMMLCTGIAITDKYVYACYRDPIGGRGDGTSAYGGSIFVLDKTTLAEVQRINYGKSTGTDPAKCAGLSIVGNLLVVSLQMYGFDVYTIKSDGTLNTTRKIKYRSYPSEPDREYQGVYAFERDGKQYAAFAGQGYGAYVYDISGSSAVLAWEWKRSLSNYTSYRNIAMHTRGIVVDYPNLYTTLASNQSEWDKEGRDYHGILHFVIDSLTSGADTGSKNPVYIDIPRSELGPDRDLYAASGSGATAINTADTAPLHLIKMGSKLVTNPGGNKVAVFDVSGSPVYEMAAQVAPGGKELVYAVGSGTSNTFVAGTRDRLDKTSGTYGLVVSCKLTPGTVSGDNTNNGGTTGGTTGGNTVTGNALDKGSTCYDALQIKLIPGDASKATYNTTTLNNWLAEVKTGHPEYGRRSLHFGAGEWYFNDTILVDKGQCSSIFSDAIPTMNNAPCRLHFDGMPIHKPAMRLTSCSPQNIGIYGDRANYHYDIDRTDIMAHQGHPELCYTETGSDLLTDSGGVDSRSHDDFIKNSKDNLATRSIGIEIMGGTCLLSHVVIMNFYTGIWTHPGNMELRDIQPCYCHYGIVNNSDTQVVNCRPYKCHVGWVINGPLIHGIGYRTDSVYTSVWATSGRWTIESLDADWCIGPALRLSGSVNSFTVNGLTSRCCTANWFDRKDANGNLISMLPDYNLDGLKWDSTGKAPESGIGWVHVDNDALVRGGYITYTSVNPHNPNDGTPPDYPERNYQCIQNELYIGERSYVEMQINVSHPSWRGITAEDVVKYHIRNDNNFDRTSTGRYGTIIVHSPYDTIRVDQQADKSCLLTSAMASGGSAGGNVLLDTTLSIAGQAADASAVGEAFENEFKVLSGQDVFLLEEEDVKAINGLKTDLKTVSDALGGHIIVSITQEEYDLLESPSDTTIYIIVEASA